MEKIEWISVNDRLPALIENENYSENVLTWCDGKLMVMTNTLAQDDEGDFAWFWANCYGDINGDGEIDDEYDPTHWMPLPEPPTNR